MSELSEDEKFLLNVIRDNGNKISYKELNNICSEKFEGVRLVLKKLKSSGFVNFEGIKTRILFSFYHFHGEFFTFFFK